jgi:hypothetical protein
METSHTNLGDHERLDFSSVGYVGPNAEVDHGSATVYSRRRPIGNFSLNKISLVFIILQMHHRQRDRKVGLSCFSAHVEHFQ